MGDGGTWGCRRGPGFPTSAGKTGGRKTGRVRVDDGPGRGGPSDGTTGRDVRDGAGRGGDTVDHLNLHDSGASSSTPHRCHGSFGGRRSSTWVDSRDGDRRGVPGGGRVLPTRLGSGTGRCLRGVEPSGRGWTDPDKTFPSVSDGAPKAKCFQERRTFFVSADRSAPSTKGPLFVSRVDAGGRTSRDPHDPRRDPVVR